MRQLHFTNRRSVLIGAVRMARAAGAAFAIMLGLLSANSCDKDDVTEELLVEPPIVVEDTPETLIVGKWQILTEHYCSWNIDTEQVLLDTIYTQDRIGLVYEQFSDNGKYAYNSANGETHIGEYSISNNQLTEKVEYCYASGGGRIRNSTYSIKEITEELLIYTFTGSSYYSEYTLLRVSKDVSFDTSDYYAASLICSTNNIALPQGTKQSNFTITNTGNKQGAYSISVSEPWIYISNYTGSVQINNYETINFDIDVAEMQEGVKYNGKITVQTFKGDITIDVSVIGPRFEDPFINKMVFVERDWFVMGASRTGSNSDPDAQPEEEPVHEVSFGYNFFIGQFEVTVAQWRAIMGWYRNYYYGYSYNSLNQSNIDDLPANYVRWEDAQLFIEKLNAKTGKKYRLPTETEWEYAARGGINRAQTKYSGSNQLDEVGWYTRNSNYSPQPVGTKKSNILSIYDMSGNVAEWCSDFYGRYQYGYFFHEVPTACETGTWHVIRGGNVYSFEHDCRVTARPQNFNNNIGFRVAISEEDFYK